MEGIQTIQALKAVQSSLPAQTTIPSDELVMLYAADGTPIAKIARDDLVKAVASVMASNSQTTFSKLLGVQANGTPMGIGASDLASVLGVSRRKIFLAAGAKSGKIGSGDDALLIVGSLGDVFTGSAVFLLGYGTSILLISDNTNGKVGTNGSVLQVKRYNDNVWENAELENVSNTTVPFWYYVI